LRRRRVSFDETFLASLPFVASETIFVAYTRFERARILGTRALQIALGAPSSLPPEETADPLEIAIREFAAGSAPLSVSRFPDAFD
jgi:DNA-directed RNA polymerase subunit K/omega